VITKESGGQMFDGVQGALSESGFTVRFLHTDIEGRYDFVTDLVFTGYIDTAKQTDVVDGKTRYSFHK
jgi:hypothetical protein